MDEGILVLCGSTSWDWIGRRSAKGAPSKDELKDLEFPGPCIYGPTSHLKISKLITHCTSSHAIVIAEGVAYTFGRNDKGQLGDSTTVSRSDPFKVALDENVIDGATGRGHSLLVTESGKVYACGDNKLFQAQGRDLKENDGFTLVKGLEDIKSVSAGLDFSVALTTAGKLLAWGNPQYGQLGDGSDHEYIGSTNRMIYDPQSPKPVKGLEKEIIQVVCGTNHCHALDIDGCVYSWGYAGYGRLGLNHSPPKDIMIPHVVPGFSDRKNPVKKIAAGPTCGLVIDSRDTLQMWGKWKNSGDGGQGTPWLYPKYFTGLNGWEVREIAAGGSSLFALADQSCISWGQNCGHGELGHGEDRPRSATNAVKVDTLESFHIKQVGCGAGFTLLLVDPKDPKFTSLETIGEVQKKRKAEGSVSPRKK